jgi:hypothetical protein
LTHPQQIEASAFIWNPTPGLFQTARFELDEPMSQVSYTDGQQMSLQEPLDIEMATGGASQEMHFVESQTDDGGSQTCAAPGLLFKNTILDVTSSWGRKWRRQDIEGGEVFYQPEVRLTVALSKLKVYESYFCVS